MFIAEEKTIRGEHKIMWIAPPLTLASGGKVFCVSSRFSALTTSRASAEGVKGLGGGIFLAPTLHPPYACCRYMTSTIVHDTPDAFPPWEDAKNLRQCDVDELRTGDTKTGVLAPLIAHGQAGAR